MGLHLAEGEAPVCSQTYHCGAGRVVRVCSKTCCCRGGRAVLLGNREHAVRHAAREGPGSRQTLSVRFAAAILTKRTSRVCSICTISCTNSSSFLRVAHPDSWAGTRPKRQTVFNFPFWAVILVPCQQRLTVFQCLEPSYVFAVVVAGTKIGCGQREAHSFFSPGSGLARETVHLKKLSEVSSAPTPEDTARWCCWW